MHGNFIFQSKNHNIFLYTIIHDQISLEHFVWFCMISENELRLFTYVLQYLDGQCGEVGQHAVRRVEEELKPRLDPATTLHQHQEAQLVQEVVLTPPLVTLRSVQVSNI